MKILYVTPRISGEGGLVRVIASKANYFTATLDYEVHILTQNRNESPLFYDFSDKIIMHNMILKGNSVKFLWDYRKSIKKKIEVINPDIVIICDGLKGYFIPWLIRTKAAVIFETHGSIFLEENKVNANFANKLKFEFIYFLKRKAAKNFTKFIVLTEESSKEWNLENMQIIPNPISFKTLEKANLKKKKAIAICRHSYEKGVDRLLLVWQKVIKIHTDWELDIYGESDLNLTYQNMAVDLQISNSINFIEPIHNVREKYNNASVFLMTSRSEGFGLALIEAMACGLPSVAFDCPCGPRAIITNNVDGFLIENDNIDKFSDAVIRLIEDAGLAEKFGTNAIESVKKYDFEEIMGKWNTLFIEITAKDNL
jgi:glycosyltransferase involved in cell wall biosynthesis